MKLNKGDEIWDIARKEIHEALIKGFNVIFDATNTKKKYRKSILKITELYNVHAIAVV